MNYRPGDLVHGKHPDHEQRQWLILGKGIALQNGIIRKIHHRSPFDDFLQGRDRGFCGWDFEIIASENLDEEE